MKKLIAATFMAVLAFVSFDTSSAMAAGNSHADIIQKNGASYNTIKVTKSLHNSPDNPTVVNYVSPVQDVHVRQASIKIDTWLGERWLRYHPLIYGGVHDSLHHALDAGQADLYVTERMILYKTAWQNEALGPFPDTVTPQTVNVKQVWYEIDTWLGPKWIGYNM
ncbi:hypothetical protein BAMA_18470 [Bacillus manliponensis]|uniref:Uncharacterized protein n=1 Tax=Bacillus manliponensis TaxID=574376 RepID=A0A073JS26_9BACI|nr:hypothetical protein [Bacillus manliponensis]KEK17125.1 hypothetical protein BAMA_18470 [Bacillus manliponensis]